MQSRAELRTPHNITITAQWLCVKLRRSWHSHLTARLPAAPTSPTTPRGKARGSTHTLHACHAACHISSLFLLVLFDLIIFLFRCTLGMAHTLSNTPRAEHPLLITAHIHKQCQRRAARTTIAACQKRSSRPNGWGHLPPNTFLKPHQAHTLWISHHVTRQYQTTPLLQHHIPTRCSGGIGCGEDVQLSLPTATHTSRGTPPSQPQAPPCINDVECNSSQTGQYTPHAPCIHPRPHPYMDKASHASCGVTGAGG